MNFYETRLPDTFHLFADSFTYFTVSYIFRVFAVDCEYGDIVLLRPSGIKHSNNGVGELYSFWKSLVMHLK